MEFVKSWSVTLAGVEVSKWVLRAGGPGAFWPVRRPLSGEVAVTSVDAPIYRDLPIGAGHADPLDPPYMVEGSVSFVVRGGSTPLEALALVNEATDGLADRAAGVSMEDRAW